MALRKCRECGAAVSSRAATCPHCGAPVKRKGFSAGFWVVLFIGLMGFAMMASTECQGPAPSSRAPASSVARKPRKPNPSSPKPRPPPKPVVQPAKLVLITWAWREESGFAIVEGEVKNVSSENLRNVEAVVGFYTAAGKFITSDSSLLDYNPILPGQTSPFKVMAGYNPKMHTAKLRFKKMWGGTIPWEKAE